MGALVMLKKQWTQKKEHMINIGFPGQKIN